MGRLVKVLEWAALGLGVLVLLFWMVVFMHTATVAWPLTPAQLLVYLGVPTFEIAAVAGTIARTRGWEESLVYTSTAIWIAVVINVTLMFMGVFGF